MALKASLWARSQKPESAWKMLKTTRLGGGPKEVLVAARGHPRGRLRTEGHGLDEQQGCGAGRSQATRGHIDRERIARSEGVRVSFCGWVWGWDFCQSLFG